GIALGRTSTLFSCTTLFRSISAADIAAARTLPVAVIQNSIISNSVNFTISAAAPPPAPVIASVLPNAATAGGAAFTLTVNGSNFVSGSSAQWNGSARTTTFV